LSLVFSGLRESGARCRALLTGWVTFMARTKRRRACGTGSVYQKNRLWSVSWVENGERRYSHGYLTKDMAEKVRANIALDRAASFRIYRPGLSELAQSAQ
jgi:hypothetical protein